jgi:hypothetical protein
MLRGGNHHRKAGPVTITHADGSVEVVPYIPRHRHRDPVSTALCLADANLLGSETYFPTRAARPQRVSS